MNLVAQVTMVSVQGRNFSSWKERTRGQLKVLSPSYATSSLGRFEKKHFIPLSKHDLAYYIASVTVVIRAFVGFLQLKR
jgi:hypothetical protein